MVSNSLCLFYVSGRSNYQNYDVHYVPVRPANPQNPSSAVYYPCQMGEYPTYDEYVIFNEAQIIPRYLVYVKKSDAKASFSRDSRSVSVVRKLEMVYKCLKIVITKNPFEQIFIDDQRAKNIAKTITLVFLI